MYGLPPRSSRHRPPRYPSLLESDILPSRYTSHLPPISTFASPYTSGSRSSGGRQGSRHGSRHGPRHGHGYDQSPRPNYDHGHHYYGSGSGGSGGGSTGGGSHRHRHRPRPGHGLGASVDLYGTGQLGDPRGMGIRRGEVEGWEAFRPEDGEGGEDEHQGRNDIRGGEGGGRRGLRGGGDERGGGHGGLSAFAAGLYADDYEDGDEVDGIYDEGDFGGGSAFAGFRSPFSGGGGDGGLGGLGGSRFGPGGRLSPLTGLGGYADFEDDHFPPRSPTRPRGLRDSLYSNGRFPFALDDYDFGDDMPGSHGGRGFMGGLYLDDELLDMAVFDDEDMDRVISDSMEQDATGPHGAPPASRTAIAGLKKKKADKKLLGDKNKADCSVCMDEVKVGDRVAVLPCEHWFHPDCVTAWLKEHDTCPHCRKSITPGSGGAVRRR